MFSYLLVTNYFQSRKIVSVFALEGSYTRTQTLSEKSKMASIWINHKIEIFSACSRLWLRSPDVERNKNCKSFLTEEVKFLSNRTKINT